jgi:hypothetical protein
MKGIEIIALKNALAVQRTPLEGHWDDLSSHFMPFRLAGGNLPDIPSASELADSEGRRSALILANGLASLIFPRESVWFEYQPPGELADDFEAVAWYRNASATAREYLEHSNFYEEIQEALIESPVYGTAALYLGELGDSDDIHFRHCPVKSYYIGEDARGRVNRFVRCLHLTASQAAGEFGVDRIPGQVRDLLSKPDGDSTTEEYIHAVLPRTIAPDRDAPENQKKPWISCVVHASSAHICQELGFDEFPFAVHRYRRFGRTVWGFGPGTTALGDARQLQYLNDLADAAAEKSVYPPVVAPSSMDGEIGLGSGEITYVDSQNDPNSASILREWATVSRYDIAKDRLQDKKQAINSAFHVDLFQLFSSRAMERQPMTATEASLISGEKLTQFSPVFGRLVSEFATPILTRLFAVLFRGGRFGQPPPGVLSPDGKGIASPSLLYKNRILLAMQERANNSLAAWVQLVSPFLQADPSFIDTIDTGRLAIDSARFAGLPEKWIRSPKQVAAIEQARAQAAQAAQAAAVAEQATNAAANLSQAPPSLRAAAESSLLDQ